MSAIVEKESATPGEKSVIPFEKSVTMEHDFAFDEFDIEATDDEVVLTKTVHEDMAVNETVDVDVL